MSTCRSNATAIPLNADNSCNLGFQCEYNAMHRNKMLIMTLGPFNSIEHPPEYCQPTVPCQIQRLQLLYNICNESQGLYEPIICRPGYYCPSPGKEELICPSGNYCPLGSHEPWPCDALAYCPEGSSRQHTMLGLVLLVFFDLVLLTIILWTPCVRIYHKLFGIRRHDGVRDPWDSELQELKSSPRSGNSELAEFVESVRRYVGVNELGLSFEFRDVSLRLPKTGKPLLMDINCSIEAGQLWGVMGASGAGKSTFVNVLTGKMDATAGQVLTCGFSGSTVQ